MKLTTFLAALAGFDLVPANPVRTGLATNPSGALLPPRARVSWMDANAYKDAKERKRDWELNCGAVLSQKGCGVGVIQGEEEDRDKKPYVKVLGAPHDDMKNSRKFRVYHDGSSRDGWRWRSKLNPPDRGHQPPEKAKQRPVVHNPLVLWRDGDAYKDEQEKKRGWEHKCGEVIRRMGCGVGIIDGEHQSTGKGDNVPYVKVLAAPEINPNMNNSRKVRVYQDGSSQEGWHAKTKKRKPSEEGQQPPDKRQKPLEVHQPLFFWQDDDAYKDDPQRREEWEQRCGKVLADKRCGIGIIQGAEETFIRPNGNKVPYVRVIGAPSASIDMRGSRKMRVFEDGSSIDRWPASKHRKSTSESGAPEVSWDPPNSYERSWPQRKKHWEEKCRNALARKGCGVGTIHKGEVKETKNGQETSYVHVEGAPSAGMEPTEQMRLYYDGSFEDGWSKRGRHLMRKAKAPLSNRRQKTMPLEDQEQTDKSQYNVAWDPPDAYGRKRKLKKSFEDACRTALARERNCDSATIHQGHHRHIDPVDGTRSFYMTVSAWNKNTPENKRLLRLYESGLSEWIQKGPLPRYETRREKGKALISVPSAYRRPPGRPPKKAKGTRPDRDYSSMAQLQQGLMPAPISQNIHQTQPTGSMATTSTQVPYPGQLHASSQAPQTSPQAHQSYWDPYQDFFLFHSPSGDQHHYTTSQGHAQFSDLDTELF